MAKQTITPGSAPIVWSTVEDAFTKINANFTELYATVLGENLVSAGNFVIGQQYTIVFLGTTDFTLIGAPALGPEDNLVGTTFVATGVGTGTGTARPKYNGIDFQSLETNLVPDQNDTYDLGTPQRRWASVYISDTLSIGGAAITNEGLTIDLPSGTTVAGQLVIDPNKTFFKEFSVNGETSVVADQFNDVLDFNAGTGIQLSVTSTNDQINITNIGVTSLAAGAGMSVGSSTGAVTVTNSGVRSATAGLGMSVNTATGAVTFANEGIVEIVSGNITNLTVGARDAATGRVVITNTKPGGNAYGTFAILNSGSAVENNLVASSTSTTVQFQEGTGINLIGTSTAGVNRVEVVNTGVTALTAGNGVTLSGSTGNITISVGSGDLKGSLFADDSTMLVDGTGAKIVGNVLTSDVTATTNVITPLVTSTGQLRLSGAYTIAGTAGNLLAQAGNGPTGGTTTLRGGISTDVGVKGGNVEIWGATGNGGVGGTAYQGDVIIQGYSGNVYIGNESIGAIANTTINGSLNVINGSIDGDITGSVFSDNSTRLIDGTEGKIVGPVESASVVASGYIQTATYADLTAIAAALPTAIKGMIVFDDGTNQFRGYDGASWVALN